MQLSNNVSNLQSISGASINPPVTEMTELKPCLKKNNNGSIGICKTPPAAAVSANNLLPANNGSVGGGVSPGSATDGDAEEGGRRRTSNVTTVERLEDDHREEAPLTAAVSSV